ncbi:MAG: hypothetical protein H7A23_07590 [Leptospiraceae bacterium]|nr:hypothetical protein [Leptospiraceae bacterium]MCP5494404.1 hypothetical protein [Leptospiraceae bacterium]
MKIVSINEKTYQFTAKGSVGSYEKMELKDAINSLLPAYKKLGLNYKKSMENGGRLTGQEKIRLIMIIKNICRSIIQIRKILMSEYLEEVDWDLQKNDTFLLNVKINGILFTIQGSLSLNEVSQINSFYSWSESFKVKIKEMLLFLKKSFEDNVITKKEAIKIVCHLDVLLCACVLIIYKLRFQDIKS